MRAIFQSMLLFTVLAVLASASPVEIRLVSSQDSVQRYGSFNLDGKDYNIVITDINKSGRLDDFLTKIDYQRSSTNYLRCVSDQIRIHCSPISFGDEQPLAKWLVLGDKLFEVKVQPDGSKMTLEPAQGAVATTLPPFVAMASFIDEQAGAAVSIYNPARQVPLPAGKWRLISYVLNRQDEQGDNWYLTCYAGMNQPVYSVDATSSSTIAFGEPFMPKLDIKTTTQPGWFSRRTVARMQFTIYDRAGTRLAMISHNGNKTKIALGKGGRPKEPTWRAINAAGEKAASGQFEYG